MHRRDYKVCRQIGDQNLQPAQGVEPEAAFAWALKQRDLAARVVFCYEAGFSGFSLARRLQVSGVEPVVMCSQKLDERCKRVSTDRRDSRAIASRLDCYLAGNQEALVPVRISSEGEEDQRALSRQRAQMLMARKWFEAQGRSLLHFKGRPSPTGWWRGSAKIWQQRIQQQAWNTALGACLEGYRRLAQAADQEVATLTTQLERRPRNICCRDWPPCPQASGN